MSDTLPELTDEEDKEQHTDPDTGKKLPVFRVLAHCVMGEDCCNNDCYKIDADVGRAVIMHQPRNQQELELHRDCAEICPVKCIVEAESWETFPDPDTVKKERATP